MESLPFSRTSSFREMFCSSPAVSVIVLCFQPAPPHFRHSLSLASFLFPGTLSVIFLWHFSSSHTHSVTCLWLSSSSRGLLSFSCGFLPLSTHTLPHLPVAFFLFPHPLSSSRGCNFFLIPHTHSVILLWLSSSSLTLCHLPVVSSSSLTLCHLAVALFLLSRTLSVIFL